MSARHLLDTDVLVDYLRGQPDAVDLLLRETDRIALSAIAVAELFAGARGHNEIGVLDDFVGALPVLPITAEIAREAGLLKARYGPSHGVGIADAIIAATAKAHGLEVMTLNTRHYPMFEGLTAPYRKA